MSKKETIYIGKKPVNSYVMAAMTVVSRNGVVTLKARGRTISRAVDVAEVVKRTLGLDVETIEIGTEVFEDREQGDRKVSTIAICLTK